jgi:hypothetical protein
MNEIFSFFNSSDFSIIAVAAIITGIILLVIIFYFLNKYF